MTLDQILERLPGGAVRNGSGYKARCPAHDDRNPSLSVTPRDGRILLHCHAGCTTENVVAALGLTMSDLGTNGTGHGAEIATYDYVDENGNLLFEVVRYEPKTFRQRRPDGHGGWTWGLGGVRRVLYRLPEVMAANFVLVCEGEKDCDTAHGLELPATCNPMGAIKWSDEYSEALRGKIVTIVADADTPGRAHAQQIAASITGVAAAVKVVELPAAKDLTEWVERGGTREALVELIGNAPEWAPANAQNLETTLVIEPFSDITAKPVEWDWPERIPRAKLTIFSGDPDLGKSTVAVDIIARRTKQEVWPDGAINTTGPGDVLMMIAEDDPEDTVKPRLIAAHADLARVHLVRCVQITQGAKKAERMLALDTDLALLEAELKTNTKIKLVVIDPITNYFGRASSAASLWHAPMITVIRLDETPAAQQPTDWQHDEAYLRSREREEHFFSRWRGPSFR